MIILHRYRAAILTPPKCASTSLHVALCRPPHDGSWICGTDPRWGEVDKHCLSPIPAGYAVHAIVRHPASRVVSLYHDWCRVRAYYGQATGDFEQRVLCLPHWEGEFWFWNAGLTEILSAAPPHTVHHVESIGTLWDALGIPPVELPRENASWSRPWLEYYTPETFAHVREIYAADFAAYGYGTDFPRTR